MSEFIVDSWVLSEASTAWREQSAQVTTAGTRVAGAGISGFGPAVQSTARPFTSAWGTIIAGLATDADDVSDHLDTAATAYLVTDMQTQRAFEAWLQTKVP